MKKGLEELDLSDLLDRYTQESKEFSAALNHGASWEDLQQRRIRMRLIHRFINEKYNEKYGQQRRHSQLPYSD